MGECGHYYSVLCKKIEAVVSFEMWEKNIYVPQRGILKLFPVLSSSGVREQPGNLNLKHQDNVGKSLLVRRDKSLTVSFVLMCGGNKICRWMVVISFSGRCLGCCKMLCVPKIGLT